MSKLPASSFHAYLVRLSWKLAVWQLELLKLNEDKSTRYHRLKRRSAVASVAMSTAVLVVLLAGGLT